MISTVTGGGPCDDTTASCDGMAAGSVAIKHPAAVSPIQGGSGGLLVAEYDNDTIREVSQVSALGTFTTVAGVSGIAGNGGDGGAATSAQLNHPEGILSTADGGFVIADANNERVRRVSPSGTITTIAGNGTPTYAGDGGAATDASLNSPAGAAVLPDGGYLIADAENGAIRRVTVPPVSTITLSPATPSGQNGWYTSVSAVVSAIGAKSTNCELDPDQAVIAYDEIPPGCPYSGKGAAVTGDGMHTIYAASINSFGDKEVPVSVSLQIDTTPPTLTCTATPSFVVGTRNATVTASVSDSLSGPSSPQASASIDTSTIGSFAQTVFGTDNAGNTGRVGCAYNVVPKALESTPRLESRFARARGSRRPSGGAGLGVSQSETISELIVTAVPEHAAVNLLCHGRGCPFISADNVTGKWCSKSPCRTHGVLWPGRHSVELTGLFKDAQFAPGSRLKISVTETNAIGRVWLFSFRAGKPPTNIVSCLEPGSTVPGAGCTMPSSNLVISAR
jgi:hypothetical protein